MSISFNGFGEDQRVHHCQSHHLGLRGSCYGTEKSQFLDKGPYTSAQKLWYRRPGQLPGCLAELLARRFAKEFKCSFAKVPAARYFERLTREVEEGLCY